MKVVLFLHEVNNPKGLTALYFAQSGLRIEVEITE